MTEELKQEAEEWLSKNWTTYDFYDTGGEMIVSIVLLILTSFLMAVNEKLKECA